MPTIPLIHHNLHTFKEIPSKLNFKSHHKYTLNDFIFKCMQNWLELYVIYDLMASLLTVSMSSKTIWKTRQHMGSWSNGASKENMVPPTTPTIGSSPDRLRGATQDLFELLERVQCSRLDDQRCVLPPYFSQLRQDVEIYYFVFSACNSQIK
uniref:CSON008261 protein n=1 Tax=Culicoides sonorensis TaxID=179676 RepID=A0A336N7H6_CULSO